MMMNLIDTKNTDSHYQHNSDNQINLTNFADQALSSVFDYNSNIDCTMSNTMNNNMNNNIDGLDVTRCGRIGSPQDKNKLLKNIRGRNTRDLKELVSNFWMQSGSNNSLQQTLQNQNQALKQSLSNSSMARRSSGGDPFGNFHPVELSNKKNNNFSNAQPNATMDMRIPLESRSSATPVYSANNLGIDKNAFRSDSNNTRSSSNGIDKNMMPPMTQSLSKFNNSRRVSMCSSSVISDDSNHSQHSIKPSATSIINAATNIVNGNDFDGGYNKNSMSMSMNMNMNMNMNTMNNMGMNLNMGMNNMNNLNVDPMQNGNCNVVSEPGPYDIVCGRNSGAYNYIGNRRFRVTIEMNLQRYIDSPTREDKTNVIKSIVWMLHEQVGARFLKKETSKKSSGSRRRGTPRYTIMTDKQAREKVGHALRDLVITARKEQQQQEKKQAQGTKDGIQQCQ